MNLREIIKLISGLPEEKRGKYEKILEEKLNAPTGKNTLIKAIRGKKLSHKELTDNDKDVHKQYLLKEEYEERSEKKVALLKELIAEAKKSIEIASAELEKRQVDYKQLSETIDKGTEKVGIRLDEMRRDYEKFLNEIEIQKQLLEKLEFEKVSLVEKYTSSIQSLRADISKKLDKQDLPKKIVLEAGDNVSIEKTELSERTKYKISAKGAMVVSNTPRTQIGDYEVTTTKIADEAITTAKILDDNVTNDKLANMTRGTVKVGGTSNAPTDLNAKDAGKILIGDGTDIKSVAVSGDVGISASGYVTIADNAITTAKIANGSVTNDKLTNDQVLYAWNGFEAIAGTNDKGILYAFYVPENTLGATNFLEIEGQFLFDNQTGGNVTFTLGLEYGSSVIASQVSGNISNSTNVSVVNLNGALKAKNSTNAQRGLLHFDIGGRSLSYDVIGEATHDSTTGSTFAITITMGTSHALSAYTKEWVAVRKIVV